MVELFPELTEKAGQMPTDSVTLGEMVVSQRITVGSLLLCTSGKVLQEMSSGNNWLLCKQRLRIQKLGPG